VVTLGRFEEDPGSEDLTGQLLGRVSSPDEFADNSRLADEWLGCRLKEINYDLGHPECQQLADHLCALGVGTLVNLMKAGRLFKKCAELGIRGLPVPPASWNVESDRVIVVAVRLATPRFITDSMPHWDSAQSSISTYYVNYVLFRFKTVYLQYCKEERQGSDEMPTENVLDLFEAKTAQSSVEDLAVARQTIREIMQLMDDQDFAAVVQLAAAGKTRAEIAATLGISVGKLDRRISQFRKKLRNSGFQGGWVDGS
jgi:Sigma-70, region 4